MANICDFKMLVKGQHEDIERFYNALSQRDNIYMGRGADADIEYEDDENQAFIDGCCKWSIQSALIDNAISMRENPDMWYFKKDKTSLEFITLVEATKEYNVEVEAFSEETGCCFMEHYIAKDGRLMLDDCVDYYEYCKDDFSTKEEMEKEYDITITDEEWNDCDSYISRGGIEWDFTIK